MDPFQGVRRWNRALSQAVKSRSIDAPARKYLVASRTDRGGLPASRARIENLVDELGFDGFLETSAKDNTGISELRNTILNAIDWSYIATVSSDQAFISSKAYIDERREAGDILVPLTELFEGFVRNIRLRCQVIPTPGRSSNDASPR